MKGNKKMIRNTLKRTKEATFMVHIDHGNNIIFGTGFFISNNGYFITANHVIELLNLGDEITFLEKFDEPFKSVLVKGAKLIKKWEKFDLALLKAEFNENNQREYFKERSDFPFLDIDYSDQEEGTPVYSFGYPLPKSYFRNIPIQDKGSIILGVMTISPRITSSIISSKIDYIRPICSSSDPKCYVIDKALNKGNSGGPIILSENGKVISVCIELQTQSIPLPNKTPNNIPNSINIPSLYCITSSLQNIQIELQKILNNN